MQHTYSPSIFGTVKCMYRATRELMLPHLELIYLPGGGEVQSCALPHDCLHSCGVQLPFMSTTLPVKTMKHHLE